MEFQSVRDLKRQIAAEVFAPIVNDLLDRAFRPKFGTTLGASPLQLLALGIARGNKPGEFMLGVRLQSNSPVIQQLVERVRALARGEVDVRVVGRVTAHDGAETGPLRKVCRPLVIGCSVAHIAATAGTLGLIARHRKTGKSVMVSNVHVLAQTGQPKLGDAITQPGRLDGGNSNNHVAALLDFVPLKFTGSNQVDAAIAVIDSKIDLAPNSLPGLGPFTIPSDETVIPGTKVMKIGRTTGLTHGEILMTEIDNIVVGYDVGDATYDDQFEITGLPNLPFSDGGDSGSLVVDVNMRAIGLVFAGNPNANDGKGLSYANHLPKVMAALALEPL